MSNNQNGMDKIRQRRGSVVPIPISNIFPRAGCPSFPGPITIAAAQDQNWRRSISNFGLPANSPSKTTSFPYDDRRGSTTSTHSTSTSDESAFEDDDYGRSIPATPLGRRMSLGAQAIRSARRGSSSGSFGESNSFNFPEHFRIRAESSVTQSQKPRFSDSPTTTQNNGPLDIQSEIPPHSLNPPTSIRPQDRRPDAFQERMLKGDFYMD